MLYKFSPSSLSLLKDCPRCFWLYFNKNISRPEQIHPSLPFGMDRVLKEHFTRFRQESALPPELQEISGGVKQFPDEKLLQKWQDHRQGIQIRDAQGNVLCGVLDFVLQKGKKVIVLNLKTRGFPIKKDTHLYYQDQLDFYNFLLEKNGFTPEKYAYLLFYHPEKVQSGSIDFQTKLVKIDISAKNAEKIFQRAVKVLNDTIPQRSAECKYCRWVEENGKVIISNF